MTRALSARRDPAWTADGFVSDRWLPVSPVTGRLDAFEWKDPLAGMPDAGTFGDEQRKRCGQRGHHGPDTKADEHAEKHPLLAEHVAEPAETGVAIDAVRR